jgi:hypothetical protein
VPRCEGGEVTIKLLKQHHAVQGVLQSEEYQRPCIWGWEANYLQGEMLALYKKWRSELGRRAQTPEQRSDYVKAYLAMLTPEERSEKARRARLTQLANSTPEQRSEAARKARAAQLANTTPEQRSAAARKREAAKREARLLRSVTTP